MHKEVTKYVLTSLVFILIFGLFPAAADAQAMSARHKLPAYSDIKPVLANLPITKNDELYIKAGAERVVKRFMDLLNFISTGLDLEISDIEKVNRESYLLPDNRIFYDSTASIEDDLRNTDISKKGKEKTVGLYLNDFDLLYRKSKDQSIFFSNIRVSEVKANQYLYVLVFFDCLFKGKSSVSGYPYGTKKRIAELKLEKVNNKWKAWIVNVHSLRTADTINAAKENVAVIENTGLEKKSFPGSPDSIQSAVQVSTIQLQKVNTSQPGEKAINGTPEELYSYYMREALFAENQKIYDEAIKHYGLALKNKPDESVQLNAKIQLLTTRKQTLSETEAKYAAGQYKEAADICEKAIKADPQCAAYYFLNGKCRERLNDLKQAIKNYNKAIEYDASNPDVYKARASLYEIDGDYTKAIADYTVYADINKTVPFTYHKIAFLNIALDNLNAAIEALDKATLLTDTIASFFYLKGELLYKQKKTAVAKTNFTKALNLNAEDAASLFYRALCELDLKETAEAGADFNHVKKLDSDGQYTKRIRQTGMDFYKSAGTQFDGGKLDSALKMLDCALAIDPANDQYRFKKGECLFLQNNFAGAIQEYTEALRLNSGNQDAYRQRGIAKLKTKKYEAAIADFTASLKLNPNATQPYKYAGDAYLLLKDYSNAITSYELALSVIKNTHSLAADIFLAEIDSRLGEAYFHFGNPFKAIENFNEALKKDNNNATVYFNRGQTFLHFNELDKAEADFKKALAADYKNPLWNFKLGELYQRKSNWEQAIAQYGMAASQDINNTLAFEPVYNRATCLVSSNRPADALRDYQAIKTNDKSKNFKNFNTEIGSVYLNVNKPDSALIYLNDALLEDPLNITAAYLKAVAYLKKNKTEDALSCLEKALALFPGKLKPTTIRQDFAALKDESRFINLLVKYY